MRTVEIKLFKFSELNEAAKQKAIENHREGMDYCWSYENHETIKKFCEIFDLRGLDFEYGYRDFVSVSFNHLDDGLRELSGPRLIGKLWTIGKNEIWTKKYLKSSGVTEIRPKYHKMRKITEIKGGPNKGKFYAAYYSNIQYTSDCPLTGYCMDYAILKPIFDYLEKPNMNTTFEGLMEDCLQSWLKSCSEDYEYHFSDEYIAEEIEENEYEFTEEGEKY